ncbi:D-aminoacyl-tRNA deacylase [Methanonatronarchaeum sp. AMET-Sl]|uniref:D-aminoacyl-tRNA deacylase n=1 Tax=Methanonatronarchaeum sp. AMET-Sl TaxID=3037654 RepID=UPI00244DFF19|nr:D-aminoacyl-tRNA deacylase [Methanonatronarchaeum sp. AMET-Sl]WGI17411.1 D-aminoacyl-tRNA deacylase [Methanonatronarchaeum sp. AMET-Sl]
MGDPASVNIQNKLLDKADWVEDGEFRGRPILNHGELRLIKDIGRHIDQNGLDKELDEENIESSCIVFPSRHSSSNGEKLLSVHTPGNIGDEAKVGGNPREISFSAPKYLKMVLEKLNQLSDGTEYKPSLEATHHGPSNLKIPTLFVEIGSGEEEWNDPVAGDIVAETILSLDKTGQTDRANGISIGGGHYAPEQTRLLLETNIALGHLMPSYAYNYEMVGEMIQKTPECSFIHLSGNEIQKQELSKYKLPVYSEGEIRDLDPLNPKLWSEFIENSIENSKPIYAGKKRYKEFKLIKINEELINMAQRFGKNRDILKSCLNKSEVIYYKKNNGTITNKFYIPSKSFKDRIEKLINCAIKTIGQEKPIEVSRREGNIQVEITQKKFNPDKALSLGVEKKQFGVLSGGKELEIEGKTITPDMVHNINKKEINLKYPPKVLDKIGMG